TVDDLEIRGHETRVHNALAGNRHGVGELAPTGIEAGHVNDHGTTINHNLRPRLHRDAVQVVDPGLEMQRGAGIDGDVTQRHGRLTRRGCDSGLDVGDYFAGSRRVRKARAEVGRWTGAARVFRNFLIVQGRRRIDRLWRGIFDRLRQPVQSLVDRRAAL